MDVLQFDSDSLEIQVPLTVSQRPVLFLFLNILAAITGRMVRVTDGTSVLTSPLVGNTRPSHALSQERFPVPYPSIAPPPPQNPLNFPLLLLAITNSHYLRALALAALVGIGCTSRFSVMGWTSSPSWCSTCCLFDRVSRSNMNSTHSLASSMAN